MLKNKYCSKRCQLAVADARWRLRRSTLDDALRRLARRDGPRSREGLTLSLLRSLWDQQNGRCAVSGVEMTFGWGNGRMRTNVSVDRINSRYGYTPENVQLVCDIVNRMKSNMTVAELREWCKAIMENNEDAIILAQAS
jgi:hypothetical protein